MKKKTSVRRAPAPVAPPGATAAERRARLEAVLDESLTRAWGAAPVVRGTLGGVPVRVASVAQPRPFWHLRTHGLSTSAGVEVALRVHHGKDEVHLPAWVAGVVERLALHAKERVLTAGQVVRWPKPFGEGAQTELEAFAVGLDPAFGTLSTPYDQVPVLLAVGITADEERLVREWSPSALLEVLARVDPTLSTALDRPSLLASPRARLAIEQRVEKEGSSMGVLQARVSTLNKGRAAVTWTLDAEAAGAVVSLLKGRIGHQRPFVVRSSGLEVALTPGDQPALSLDGPRATLKLNQVTARQLRATLKDRPGTYAWDALPNFAVEVVQ